MENLVSIKDLGLISPLIVLFIFSLLPITVKLFLRNKEQNRIGSLLQALIGLGIAGGFLFLHADDKAITAFQGALQFDGISRWISLLSVIIGGLSLLISFNNVNTKHKLFSEHIFLTLSSVIGMFVMTWANDLIVVFIGLEIMSLALYMLIALSHEQIVAKEAAFKYFILGSLSSAIFLYGIALLYGSVGSTYLPDIAQAAPKAIQGDLVFILGSMLLMVGMLFKVSIFPFHSWTPDVYEGAPTSMTAFMSTGVKLASFAVILRFITTGIIEDQGRIFEILQWLAVFTMLAGNIAALIQDNLKRILAYSSVAHSGYVLVGVIVAGLGGQSNTGISSTLFYLLTYAFVNIGLLALVSIYEDKEERSVSVHDLKGLAKSNPFLAFIATILLLSLAGIPPLAGFFGKFYLFSGAVDLGLYWLAIWGVINSVISVYYYLRPVVMMYMMEAEEATAKVMPDFLARVNMLIAVLLVIFLGIYSGGFFEKIQAAVISMY